VLQTLPLAELLRSFAVDLRPREKDKDSFGLTLEAAPKIRVHERVGWPSPTARMPRRLPVATPGCRLARLQADATGQPR